MARYLLRRLVGMAVVVALVLTIAFVIVRVAPGDPAALILGPEATARDVAELRARLGLDRPILVQYAAFLRDAARGDLGRSLFFNLPVTTVLAARAEPTAMLALLSLFFSLLVAVPIGIYAAFRRGSLFDQSAIALAMLAASLPSFWTGLIAQRWLATELGWFAASGYGGPESTFFERMQFLILPALVLGLVNSALILRFTRASMLDVLDEDYIRTARAKGLPRRQVVLKHALSNALIPIVTVIGIIVSLLLSGAVVTEALFSIPGMGQLLTQAVLNRDYPMVQGGLLLVTTFLVLVNITVDVLYAVLDPRVRYE
jgi:peptide/nickel transport system permease protein